MGLTWGLFHHGWARGEGSSPVGLLPGLGPPEESSANWWLKTAQIYHLQFWGPKVWKQFPTAETRGSTGPCSFCRPFPASGPGVPGCVAPHPHRRQLLQSSHTFWFLSVSVPPLLPPERTCVIASWPTQDAGQLLDSRALTYHIC